MQISSFFILPYCESFFKSKAYYEGARAVELLEEDIKYGVNVARKGWLEKTDVVNTLTREQILCCFKGK